MKNMEPLFLMQSWIFYGKNQFDPDIELILIMCYSGFRISAYKTIFIDFDAAYFKGGVKTSSSKERIVPIHSAIRTLVKRRMEREQCLLDSDQTFQEAYE